MPLVTTPIHEGGDGLQVLPVGRRKKKKKRLIKEVFSSSRSTISLGSHTGLLVHRQALFQSKREATEGHSHARPRGSVR